MKKRYYDEWEKPKRRSRQILNYTLLLLGSVIFLAVAIVIYFSALGAPEEQAGGLNLTPTPVPTLIPDATQTPPVELYAPLADAINQNPDTIAWIHIQETLINYPVVKTNNNTYYMKNGYDKAPNSAGAIFMDKNSDPAGVHMVLYGRAMSDGSRFAALLKYKSESYMQKNNTITLELASGSRQYRVFAAYPQPEDFDCLQTKFETIEAWQEHVKKCAGYSIYDQDYGDQWGQVLTLVAVDEESGENFIVQAGLVG